MEMTNNIPYTYNNIIYKPGQLIYNRTRVYTSCDRSLIRDDLVNYWIVLTNYLFGHSMGKCGIAYLTEYN